MAPALTNDRLDVLDMRRRVDVDVVVVIVEFLVVMVILSKMVILCSALPPLRSGTSIRWRRSQILEIIRVCSQNSMRSVAA